MEIEIGKKYRHSAINFLEVIPLCVGKEKVFVAVFHDELPYEESTISIERFYKNYQLVPEPPKLIVKLEVENKYYFEGESNG